ncbi:MAG: DUF2125 domain-containing protein [Rhizomicrobium sp.]|jgi:hypothetical protein
MNYSHRFFLYAPVAAFLLIALAVMIWWNVAATAFDRHLSMDNGREVMPGIRMTYASKSTSGFPFSLDTVLDHVTFDVQTRTGPLQWQSEHFAIHALTYGPQQQIFEAAGQQTLSWTDSYGQFHRVTFLPGSLRASAIVSHGRLARFDLDAVAVASRDFAANRIQFHIRHAPDRDALQFAVSGDNVRLAPDLRAGFGPVIGTARIEGDLEPALSVQPLLSGDADWRTAADYWRAHSGVLTITHAQLDWGSTKASASGPLLLDTWHRPSGVLTMSLVRPPRPSAGTDAKLANAIARLAASVPQYPNGQSSYAIWFAQGRVGVSPGKPENIVIAVDANGNVTWNGAPMAYPEVRTRLQSLPAPSLYIGALAPLY